MQIPFNMNSRKLAWEGSRTIEYTPVEEKVYAFRSEIFQGGVSKKVHEGLATKSAILKAFQDTPIVETERVTGYGSQRVYLCKPGIVEGWRTISYGKDEWYKNLDDHLIRNPYTYLKEHGRGDTVLLVPNTGDGNLYGLDGKTIYPKAIHYEYIRGRVHNGAYDLEAALEILKRRTDIVWGVGEERSYSWKPVEPSPKIHPIPYYNVDENHSAYLDFTWQPTQADWDKVKDLVKGDSFFFEDAVMKEIFKLPPAQSKKKKKACDCDHD